MKNRVLDLCLVLLLSTSSSATEGSETISGSCNVDAEHTSSIQPKKVVSKTFDCAGKCPKKDYGDAIFNECCTRCNTWSKQGPEYFGMCHGCGDTDTFEGVAEYLTGMKTKLGAAEDQVIKECYSRRRVFVDHSKNKCQLYDECGHVMDFPETYCSNQPGYTDGGRSSRRRTNADPDRRLMEANADDEAAGYNMGSSGIGRSTNSSKNPSQQTRMLTDSQEYTASCTAGVGNDGAIPDINVKVWPCSPCKDIPIVLKQCCADCASFITSGNKDIFWICKDCNGTSADKYSNRNKEIIDHAKSVSTAGTNSASGTTNPASASGVPEKNVHLLLVPMLGVFLLPPI